MCIKKCWMTLLEIKENLSAYKKSTNDKESYTIAEETDTAWPFPMTRPSNSGEDDDES